MEHLSQEPADDFDSQQTILYDPELYDSSGIPLQSTRTMIRDPFKPILIEYVDMSNMPDNGQVIPDKTSGQLQPLVDNNNPVLQDLLKDINMDQLTQVMSQPDNVGPAVDSHQEPG